MRNFKMGLITLAASAAVFASTTGAAAGTQSAAKADSTDCTGLVNVCEFKVLNGSNVAVLSGLNVAAALNACPNLNVAALGGLIVGGQATTCSNVLHNNYKFIQRTK